MVPAALWPSSGSESWEAWAQAECPPSPPWALGEGDWPLPLPPSRDSAPPMGVWMLSNHHQQMPYTLPCS